MTPTTRTTARGVPCRAAHRHAAHAVANWNATDKGARLEAVEVPVGIPEQMAAAAREAILISTAATPPHSHTPGEDGYDARTEWDKANRQNLAICTICGEVIGILCG